MRVGVHTCLWHLLLQLMACQKPNNYKALGGGIDVLYSRCAVSREENTWGCDIGWCFTCRIAQQKLNK